MPDASNSESKEKSGGDSGDSASADVEPQTRCAIWTNLLAFVLFTSVAIAHSYVSTQISKEFET